MKTSRLLSGLGAVAMAVVPVAAQAGTRAADTGAIAVQPVKMSGVERGTESVTTKSELGGSAVIIAALAAIAVIVGIIIAVDDDDTTD
ncbi:hypothetical protein [Erythrobacter sp. SD-21]|uniref:hypothetical protein n=1 Tax=Erythrobacter sp. SD-21 TaxID=161528 RepID=UPI000153F351|nr:hypothetical protein [Erythrobacter sp. SD-21]EDL50160.1 hypothetical protein ED21_26853 [Erythrobacter sp. SD-21]